MNGLMKNFDVNECLKKDKAVQAFIQDVNPYRSKPSLGIDLRKLSRYAKENAKSVPLMPKSELSQFAL